MIIITRLAFTMRCVLSHHHHCYSHLMVWMFALWFAFAVSAPADTEADFPLTDDTGNEYSNNNDKTLDIMFPTVPNMCSTNELDDYPYIEDTEILHNYDSKHDFPLLDDTGDENIIQYLEDRENEVSNVKDSKHELLKYIEESINHDIASQDTDDELGEHNYWPYVKKAHDDGAHYQSPVDIITRFAERRYLPFLRTEGYWNFERADVVITNTGHTVCVRLANNTKAVPYIMGGPLLKHKYMFEQMHFHWGKDDHGSEHEINGHKYAMEVHIVHYRSDYGSFDKATKFDDGLSVVAFFGQIQAEDNPEFKTFATDLRHITQPDTAIDRIFMEEFSWLKNTALRQRYFTYEGSLTTEPYAECVIWIVFTETIGISRNQLAEFRHLRSHDGEMLVNGNDRDLQPFNNRTILYAF